VIISKSQIIRFFIAGLVGSSAGVYLPRVGSFANGAALVFALALGAGFSAFWSP
jgi:hypothetical protein